MLCPHSEPVPGGQGHYTHTQIDTGFGAEDGWDVRVWQVDADKHKEQKLDLPPFKVMVNHGLAADTSRLCQPLNSVCMVTFCSPPGNDTG